MQTALTYSTVTRSSFLCTYRVDVRSIHSYLPYYLAVRLAIELIIRLNVPRSENQVSLLHNTIK
jgi:hypothetical protein